MPRPYLLAETNWKAVKATNYEVAVLPWAATEAHNYHLPYGTDIIEGEAIAAEAGRIAWEAGAKVIILPCIPFGVNTGQTDITLDMNLMPSTQLAILRDLITVLDRQGIKKLVVFNSHGGNSFRTMLRELGVEFPDMLLVETNWFKTFDRYDYVEEGGDHACELETSLVLHLRPELVLPLSEADDGAEKEPRIKAFTEPWVWRERPWSQVTASTGTGNPAKSTAEKGARFFKDVTAKFGQLFIDLAEVDKDDFYK
ncbi:creatininase family protein [Neolewinella aurantiaca]|uniref:Creatininase family protein n=1 Tax=Neolewinella aurantiaca TaxID=2602767 RepID=A0A5C7FIU1_9BACT|nr:creatininase family protein [Neolewinella aurantiaca]TXF91161.1 creatininase family protein [Neolewinella aurantiaca]